MKIGLDVHGVIDRFPRQFAAMSQLWRFAGHEVHIVTGESWETAQSQVDAAGVLYTHHFSIVDHHKALGTPMRLEPSGWWMDKETWDRSKGDYARSVGLDAHIEDSLKYAPWFDPACAFIHVGGTHEAVKKMVAVMRIMAIGFDMALEDDDVGGT